MSEVTYEATIYSVNVYGHLTGASSFPIPEDEYQDMSFPVVTQDDLLGTLYLNARKVGN